MALTMAAVDAVPGPHPSPLTGNAGPLRRDLLGELVRGRQRYGDLVRYQVGPRPPVGHTFLVAHHPDDVRLVLSQTGRTLTKDTAMFRAAGDVLGRSLLTDDGPGYRRQRRIVQPLFTARQVSRYAPLMAQEALRAADGVARGDLAQAPDRADRAGRVVGVGRLGRDGALVDLHLLAMRYTLRVVGRTLFGDDVERLVPVFDALMPEVGDAIRRRGLQVVQLPLRWPTPRNHRPRRLHRRLQEVVQDVLAVSAGSGGRDGRNDLVTRLQGATDPAGAVGLTAQEVRDQALVFLLAGHETTAAALTSTLHLFGCHPRAQVEVAAELDQV